METKRHFNHLFYLLSLLLLQACFVNPGELKSIKETDDSGSDTVVSDKIDLNLSVPNDFVSVETVDISVTALNSTPQSYAFDFSESGCDSSSTWLSYQPTITVSLPLLNAVNDIWVKLKSETGEISDCKSIAITQDNIAPQLAIEYIQSVPTTGLGVSKGPKLSLSSVTDIGSGVQKLEAQVREFIGNKLISDWAVVTDGQSVEGLTLNSSKQYVYRVRITDNAGNLGKEKILPPWSIHGVESTFSSIDPPISMSVDIDGDGDEDIVSVGNGTSELSTMLYENIGDQMFLPTVISKTTGRNFVNVGDIDGDNDLDIITGTFLNIILLRNDGSGGFEYVDLGLTTTGSINHVLLLDQDGDGDSDIFYSSSSEVRYFQNNGSLSFTDKAYVSVSSAILKSIDIDKDDDLDLVIGSYAGTINLYLNNGTSIPSTSPILVSSKGNRINKTNDMIIDDIDGDGDIDVLNANYASSSYEIVLNKNSGTNTFTSSTLVSNIDSIAFSRLQFFDFDNDDDKDIIYDGKLNTGERYFLENNGSGVFSNTLSSLPESTKIFALTHKGGTDQKDTLITSQVKDGIYNLVSNKFYNSDTSLTEKYIWDSPIKHYRHYKVADLNNDTKMDLVGVTDECKVFVHNNLMVYSAGVEVGTGISDTYCAGLAIEDLDFDGDKDIVVIGWSANEMYLLINDGNLNFTLQTPDILYRFFDPIVLDYDQDGDMDIIGNFNHDLQLYRNDGSFNFTYESLFAQNAFDEYQVMDFDNDSDLDIVFADGNLIKLYKNNGSGNYVTSTLTTVSQSVYGLAVLKLNSDAYYDVFYKTMFGSMYAATSDASLNFSADSLISSDTVFYENPLDIDGDGDTDLVGFKSIDCSISLFQNDGSGNLTKVILSNNICRANDSTVSPLVGNEVGDFDNNGTRELVINTDNEYGYSVINIAN